MNTTNTKAELLEEIRQLENELSRLQYQQEALNAENREMREALEANRIFHTPLVERALNDGGRWDSFQQDAIHRTDAIL
jgi:hypothetical protein